MIWEPTGIDFMPIRSLGLTQPQADAARTVDGLLATGNQTMAQLRITIVAPVGVVWKGPAIYIKAPGVDGDFGVLPGHQPFLSLLRSGKVVITCTDRTKLDIAVDGGFMLIQNNSVTLFVGNDPLR